MPEKRRPAKLNERVTPCEGCGFPLTNRHHLLDVASYGENECTAQLCGACHDLFHVMERALVFGKKSSKQLLGDLCLKLGSHDSRFCKIHALVKKAKSFRAKACRISMKAMAMEFEQQ